MVDVARQLGRMFSDSMFWLAVVAGPFVWAGLWVLSGYAPLPLYPKSVTELLLPVIIYPVLEEVVFRGAIQGYLRERKLFLRHWHGITLANFVTSFIFTMLHFLNHIPIWAALVMFPSIVFGWARDRYNCLLAPILLHVFYNAGLIGLF